MRRVPPQHAAAVFSTAIVALIATSCGTEMTQPTVQQVISTVELTVSQDTLTALGATAQFSAIARDADGNEVSGATFSWASSDGAVASIDDDGRVMALANGDATITVTASKGGRAESAAIPVAVIQQVADIVLTPDASTMAAGATQQFAAVGTDANDNPVDDLVFLWVSSDHNVATIDQTGLSSGVGSGTTTITAVGQGQPGSTSLIVTGEITREVTEVAFTIQPTDAVAGAAINPAIEVELRDASGTVVAGARDAVTITLDNNPGGATIMGSTTVSAIDGVASFSGIALDKSGEGYSLTAATGALTSATSTDFAVGPGTASRLAFLTQPADVEGNVPFAEPVRVAVLDEYGNVVVDAAQEVTVSVGNNPLAPLSDFAGRLDGTSTSAPTEGIATFRGLSVDSPGSGFTLAANAPNLSGAESTEFAVSLTSTLR